ANQLHVVVLGTDGNVYQKNWNGTSWSSYSTLGQPPKAVPIWQNYPQTQALTPVFTAAPVTVDAVVEVVRQAEAAEKKLHAFRSLWSYSACAVSDDYMIDSRLLNSPLQQVQQALLPGVTTPVYHVQSGITIRDLYTKL